MGNLGLFTGIETFDWTYQDVDTMIAFLKENNIPQWVLKVYEIGTGDWYQRAGGSVPVVNYIRSKGIDVLPYGFFYGNDLIHESEAVLNYLKEYGQFCMNMESAFDGSANEGKCQYFAKALANHPGELSISTWANPGSHGWLPNIASLNNLVHTWMPECYDDGLVKLMYEQYPKVAGNIQPTFHITQTSPVMAGPYAQFTLWELAEAKAAVSGNLKAYHDIWVRNNHTTTSIEQQAQDVWGASPLKIPTGSGIYGVWLEAFTQEKFNFGYPVSPEFKTVNWNGEPIVMQYFASGVRAEFNSAVQLNKCSFIGMNNSILFQG